MKYCEKCGNELFDEGVICPKCGCAVRNVPQRTEEVLAQLNVCALVGFILSLVSVLTVFNLFGLLAVAGFVNSVIGLVHCNKKKQRGKGYAIAGIVVGAIFALIGFLAWIEVFLYGTWLPLFVLRLMD